MILVPNAMGSLFGITFDTAAVYAGQLQGLSNAIGWTTVVLALAFTLGWASAFAATRERGSEEQRAPAR